MKESASSFEAVMVRAGAETARLRLSTIGFDWHDRRDVGIVLSRRVASRRVAPGRLVLTVLVASMFVGCGYPAYRPSTPSAESGVLRVDFLEQDDDVFKFMIYSRGDRPMVIRRDEVFLVIDGQRYTRVPGGLKSTYDLPPGGAHDVNVAYDFSRLDDVSEFSISFETAVALNGSPVRGPVLQFSRAE